MIDSVETKRKMVWGHDPKRRELKDASLYDIPIFRDKYPLPERRQGVKQKHMQYLIVGGKDISKIETNTHVFTHTLYVYINNIH